VHEIIGDSGGSYGKAGEGRAPAVQGEGFKELAAPVLLRTGKQIRTGSGTRVNQEALSVLHRLMGDNDKGQVSLTELKKITYGTCVWLLRKSKSADADFQ
jgi:hypothetical protein